MSLTPFFVLAIYLLIALAWWGASSSDARRMLRQAERCQEDLDSWPGNHSYIERRDRCLDQARESARSSRRALYWLPWLGVMATRALREHTAEVHKISTGNTPLDPIRRADRIKALEKETERLRKEQGQE